MSAGRRRVLVRTAGAVGVVSQVLVGLMGIVIFPAALVSFVTGAAGMRLVRRDLEASAMRFGVALLASLVGLVFGFASGAAPMMASAIVSTASFGAAWALVQRMERDGRAAFGIKHRDWERRQAELVKRRDALADGSAPMNEPRSRAGCEPGDPVPGEDDWWDGLQER